MKSEYFECQHGDMACRFSQCGCYRPAMARRGPPYRAVPSAAASAQVHALAHNGGLHTASQSFPAAEPAAEPAAKEATAMKLTLVALCVFTCLCLLCVRFRVLWRQMRDHHEVVCWKPVLETSAFCVWGRCGRRWAECIRALVCSGTHI